MNYICIIPARSGSKRLKNKNTIKVNKKKLFDYTLEAALKTRRVKKIIITTNIKNLTSKNNKKIIFIKRPSYLCKNICSTESAMQHSINKVPHLFDNIKTAIILLQPTSPLRDYNDINNAINVFEKGKYDSLLSAYLEKPFIWKKKGNNLKSLTYNYKNRVRTQNMKESILENGAIYICKYKGFKKFNNRLFGKISYSLMSKRNSLEIDYAEDIKIFKSFINYKKNR